MPGRRGREVKIMTQVIPVSKPLYPQESFICEMPWNFRLTATLNSLVCNKSLGLLTGYVAEEDRRVFPDVPLGCALGEYRT